MIKTRNTFNTYKWDKLVSAPQKYTKHGLSEEYFNIVKTFVIFLQFSLPLHLYYYFHSFKNTVSNLILNSNVKSFTPCLISSQYTYLKLKKFRKIFLFFVVEIHCQCYVIKSVKQGLMIFNDRNNEDYQCQGTHARKVISEMYAFFVLQCSVFWRKSKHKTDVEALHGIHFHKSNLWNSLVIGNYYVNYQNHQN